MAIADWTPTVTDVANLTFARAKGRWTGGDSSVNPLAFDQPDRVTAVIAIATGLVAPQLGGDGLNETFWPAAKSLICLKTAMLIEPGAWPEQAKPDKSAWEQWQAQYDVDMPAIVKAVVRFGDDASDDPGASQLPIGHFPPPGPPRREFEFFPFGQRLEEW